MQSACYLIKPVMLKESPTALSQEDKVCCMFLALCSLAGVPARMQVYKAGKQWMQPPSSGEMSPMQQ